MVLTASLGKISGLCYCRTPPSLKNNAHHLDGEDDETVNEKLPSLIESLALRANPLIPLRILIIVTHPHKDNDDIKNTLHSNMTTNHNDNSNTNK